MGRKEVKLAKLTKEAISLMFLILGATALFCALHAGYALGGVISMCLLAIGVIMWATL
jgi:hypothetical protein